jgi:hypothetical protein
MSQGQIGFEESGQRKISDILSSGKLQDQKRAHTLRQIDYSSSGEKGLLESGGSGSVSHSKSQSNLTVNSSLKFDNSHHNNNSGYSFSGVKRAPSSREIIEKNIRNSEFYMLGGLGRGSTKSGVKDSGDEEETSNHNNINNRSSSNIEHESGLGLNGRSRSAPKFQGVLRDQSVQTGEAEEAGAPRIFVRKPRDSAVEGEGTH